MSKARKFIFYSTIFMLFGNSFYLGKGGTYQLFYLVMAINLMLMLHFKKVWVPRGILFLVGILVFSGVIGIVRDTDTLVRAAKEITGIVGSAFYFACFFLYMDFKLEDAFKAYAKMAYRISIIGFIYFPIDLWLHQSLRLRSILTEPAAMAFTCLPALYYYADQYQRFRKHRKELIVIGLAMMFAQSSTGYIGILFGVCLFFLRYKKLIAAIPVIVVTLGTAIYFISDSFATRFDDTLNTIVSSDVSGSNISTYVLFTNLFVMQRVLEEHPVLGNGIGSHGESFYHYIGDLPLGDYEGTDIAYLNAEDASALGTRLLSDMGISGALLLVWFVWHFRPRGKSQIDVMSKSIYIFFFIKILRGGTYFEDEQYFFVCFYALAHIAIQKQQRQVRRSESHNVESEAVQVLNGGLPAARLA